ncbi:MAG: metal ABC transporter substrate-binding protein [Dehalococcoidia bacterium]|nr:metal ABC transporter substrate-binding protein [Dehalococcoidia bacterium]
MVQLRRRLRPAGLAWLLSLLVLPSIMACAGTPASGGPASQVWVAAGIPPLGDFVREVGGNRVRLVVMVPPGASVETYEPTPQQVQFVAQAKLLVLNGLGLEFWAKNVIQGSGNANLLVADTSNGVTGLIGGEGGGANPHIWLDPTMARIQTENIRDALIKVDPDGAEAYRTNAALFIDQLRALDQEIAGRISGWRYRQFIAFHPAWQYFAAHYGLEQVASIEEFPGKEPSPQYLAQIVQQARSLPARAVFAEPGLSPKAAQAIASEAGKEVLLLDDLGGAPGRATYIELLRYDVDQMEKALK